jgi:hypothetical protein
MADRVLPIKIAIIANLYYSFSTGLTSPRRFYFSPILVAPGVNLPSIRIAVNKLNSSKNSGNFKNYTSYKINAISLKEFLKRRIFCSIPLEFCPYF